MSDNAFLNKLMEGLTGDTNDTEYITLYKYTDLEGAEKLIYNNTFRFSSVQVLNDSKELNFENVRLENQTFSLLGNKELAETDSNMPLEVKHYLIQNTWSELRRKTGITCFTRTFNNKLMWEKYADKHKGVCIRFRINLEKAKELKPFIISSVKYDNSPVNSEFNTEEQQYIALIECCRTKEKIWEYENEIRIMKLAYLKRNQDFALHNFEKYASIVSVYFGAETTKDQENKIKLLFSNKKERPNYYSIAK